MIIAGITVSGKYATLVVLTVEDDEEEFELQSDITLKLESGDRPSALGAFYTLVSNTLKSESVDRAYFKATSVSRSGMGKAHLEAAEARGVAIAAAASVCEASVIQKAKLSRQFGDRKADEYISDDVFWEELDLQEIRKGSREAALTAIYGLRQ